MGNSHLVDGRAPVHGFYSSSSWIEGTTAVRQLESVAEIPGIRAVAGMPDLHRLHQECNLTMSAATVRNSATM